MRRRTIDIPTLRGLAGRWLALVLLLPFPVLGAGRSDSPSYQFPVTGYVHVQWKCTFARECPEPRFILRRARLRYQHSFFESARTEFEAGLDDLIRDLNRTPGVQYVNLFFDEEQI